MRNRKSLVDSHERRKSRRHSTGTSPLSMSLNTRSSPRLNHTLGVSSLNSTLNSSLPDDDDGSSSSQSSQGHLGEVQLNGSYKENKGNYLLPTLGSHPKKNCIANREKRDAISRRALAFRHFLFRFCLPFLRLRITAVTFSPARYSRSACSAISLSTGQTIRQTNRIGRSRLRKPS